MMSPSRAIEIFFIRGSSASGGFRVRTIRSRHPKTGCAWLATPSCARSLRSGDGQAFRRSGHGAAEPLVLNWISAGLRPAADVADQAGGSETSRYSGAHRGTRKRPRPQAGGASVFAGALWVPRAPWADLSGSRPSEALPAHRGESGGASSSTVAVGPSDLARSACPVVDVTTTGHRFPWWKRRA